MPFRGHAQGADLAPLCKGAPASRRSREQKRKEIVAAIQRTPEYMVTELHNQRTSAGWGIQSMPPMTPDHTDRKISKRTWEKAMKEWRVELRAFFEYYQTNIERLWFQGSMDVYQMD